ncbi:MAG: Chromate resistance protein ChrB [Sphingomonadaceae bacterium]
MRFWRTLKSLGYSALRDGAYLLPDLALLPVQLNELASETIREGGSASLVTVHADSAQQSHAYQRLFGQTEDYAAFAKPLHVARNTLATTTVADLNRTFRKLRRNYEAIRAIDYFPDEASVSAAAIEQELVAL